MKHLDKPKIDQKSHAKPDGAFQITYLQNCNFQDDKIYTSNKYIYARANR